jgi:hypothetical protein
VPWSSYVNRRFKGMPSSLSSGLATCCTLVSCSADFRPWKWRWNVPPKLRFTYGLHGAVSQKMATFIATTVRTSTPTTELCVSHLGHAVA